MFWERLREQGTHLPQTMETSQQISSILENEELIAIETLLLASKNFGELESFLNYQIERNGREITRPEDWSFLELVEDAERLNIDCE